MYNKTANNHPLRALPIAMSILAVGVAWPQIIHPAHLATDWNDLFRGGVFGFAIGLMLLIIARLLDAQRSRRGGS